MSRDNALATPARAGAAAMDLAEVEALARDRRLVRRELHVQNAYYGHDVVLKRYCGLPEAYRLKVAVEHGVAVVDHIWQIDLETRMPVILCASQWRADRYRELARGGRIAIPVGPMFRYVSGPPSPPTGPRRLVVFPAHSTHHISAAYDADEFAAQLAPYRDEFDEVQICVYWKDVLSGDARRWAERGFDCVTAGHLHDSRFLVRLRSILEGAHAVVSNDAGSHMLYAVLAERPAWLVAQEVAYTAPDAVLARDGASREQRAGTTMQKLKSVFQERHAEVTDEQRAFVHELTGMDHFRTPAELRAILADAEERYRRQRSFAERSARGAVSRLRHVKDRAAIRLTGR